MSSLKLQLNDGRTVKDALQTLRKILKNHKARQARLLLRGATTEKFDEATHVRGELVTNGTELLNALEKTFKNIAKVDKVIAARRKERPTDKTAGRNRLR